MIAECARPVLAAASEGPQVKPSAYLCNQQACRCTERGTSEESCAGRHEPRVLGGETILLMPRAVIADGTGTVHPMHACGGAHCDIHG